MKKCTSILNTMTFMAITLAMQGAQAETGVTNKADLETSGTLMSDDVCRPSNDFDADLCVDTARGELEGNPQNSLLLSHLAYGLGQKGEIKEALEVSTQATQINPLNGYAYRVRGYLEIRSNLYKEADLSLTRAIELNERAARVYVNRCFARQKTENFSAAIEDCTTALEIDPQDAYAYNFRALAHENSGNVVKAALDFEKSVDVEPQNAWLYLNRAMFLERSAVRNEALRETEKSESEQLTLASARSIFPVPYIFDERSFVRIGQNESFPISEQALGVYDAVPTDNPIWLTEKVHIAEDRLWLTPSNEAAQAVYEAGAGLDSSTFMDTEDGLAQATYWVFPTLWGLQEFDGNTVATMKVQGDALFPHCVRTDVDGRPNWSNRDSSALLVTSMGVLCFDANYNTFRVQLGMAIASKGTENCLRPILGLNACLLEDYVFSPKTQYFRRTGAESIVSFPEPTPTKVDPVLLLSLSKIYFECQALFVAKLSCAPDASLDGEFRPLIKRLWSLSDRILVDAGVNPESIKRTIGEGISRFQEGSQDMCDGAESRADMIEQCVSIARSGDIARAMPESW